MPMNPFASTWNPFVSADGKDNSKSVAWTFVGYQSKVVDGKQHWSIAGTQYEHVSEANMLSPLDVSSYFPDLVHQTNSIRLERELCKTLISHDIAAALHFWRDLYRAHMPCSIDYALWTWTDALLAHLLGSGNMSKALSRLIDAGLFEFYQEIIHREEFFYDRPTLVFAVFVVITETLTTVKDHPCIEDSDHSIRDAVNSLAANICRVTWEHRSRLLVEQDVLDDNFGHLKQSRASLHRLLVAYYRFHQKSSDWSDSEMDAAYRHMGYEYIRRMTLFMWFHCDESLFMGQHGVIEGVHARILTFVRSTMHSSVAEDPEPTAFALSEILHEYGAAPVLSRMNATLSHSKVNDDDLFRVLLIVQLLLLRSQFFPHFASSGVLGGLREALDRCERRTPTCHSALLITTLDIYSAVATNVPTSDGRALLIRRYDVVGLLSRCVLVTAELGFPFPERCCQHLYVYVLFSKALCKRHGQKNVLRLALIKSARWHWYYTLKTLREMDDADPDVMKGRRVLEKAWVLFGEALGLNEGREEADYQRDTKRFTQLCAWQECPHHTNRPSAPLSTCKGCGEASYCGKICQIRDWKGHKQVCKRIKNQAHTSKT